MSPDEIAAIIKRADEIKKACKEATEGPWFFNSYSAVGAAKYVPFDDECDCPLPRREPHYTEHEWNVCYVPSMRGDTAAGRHKADAEFIASARQWVPELLDALLVVHGRLEEERRMIQSVTESLVAAEAERDGLRAALRKVVDADRQWARNSTPETENAYVEAIADARVLLSSEVGVQPPNEPERAAVDAFWQRQVESESGSMARGVGPGSSVVVAGSRSPGPPRTFYGVYAPSWGDDRTLAAVLRKEVTDDVNGPTSMAITDRNAALLLHAADRIDALSQQVVPTADERQE